MSLLNAIINLPVPPLPPSYSQALQQLANYLLNKSPSKRPAARDILLNPLIIVQLRQFMLENAKPVTGKEKQRILVE